MMYSSGRLGEVRGFKHSTIFLLINVPVATHSLSSLTGFIWYHFWWLSFFLIRREIEKDQESAQKVSQVTTAKLLGVTIDNKLYWSSHVDKLTKKVAFGIGAIKRIRHLVTCVSSWDGKPSFPAANTKNII